MNNRTLKEIREDFERLNAEDERLNREIKKNLESMEELIKEAKRVADVAENAPEILKELREAFKKQTALDETDLKFLFFATALQTLRWILINYFSGFGQSSDQSKRLPDNDKSIKDKIKKAIEEYKKNHLRDPNDSKSGYDIKPSKKYKTWMEIITRPVPFDAIKGSAQFDLGLNGRNHREKTLGHDPILGWVFGTMNIISSTCTMTNFRTFNISDKNHFVDETTFFHGFVNAYESIKEDKYRLPAAIFAEGVHLKSDEFTKMGLPIPILSVFSEELAGKLYLEQYDNLCFMRDIKIIGMEALFSIIINMVIGLIHGLYYDPKKHESRDLYEVKTRKILSYSNLIASSSNVLYVALMGKDDAWKSLDFGGIADTLYRLFKDSEFIEKVKDEFIYGNFDKLIQGETLHSITGERK